ncbi:hypothetical protein PF001_g29701 [Phytophthora fragariae]|uniref:ZSWIM1/3 RNaseH-like domain-containing protein n=1 Tax=Phytophthora fragariae TaxID=53985 RepID=A0A6A4B8P7_9STRA|nr:hypothetical protein PF003_g33303 [Phytophthora fragariae]KAE9268317.1 hypothetical protein PF001_g29701 [Phytophthora fragariae]
MRAHERGRAPPSRHGAANDTNEAHYAKHDTDDVGEALMQVPGTARQEDSYDHVGEGGSAVEDCDRQRKADGAKDSASPDDDGEDDADESKNSEVQEAGDAATRSARDGSEGECRVRVDPPQIWHGDWDAWNTYFEGYCRRSLQVLPIQDTQNHVERNRRIKMSKKGMLGDIELFPEKLDPYMRVYICTHGWKPRKSRAQGKRPRQHIRSTGCKFRFVVQWQHTEAGWKLRVMSGGHYFHNHEISTDAYNTYPCSRGVSDPMVEARVEGMLDAGAKRSKIYQYLVEHDQNVIMSDVDNMVSSRQSAITTTNDHDATAAEVARFNAADAENVSTVTENESGTVGVISLSTAHMRRMFSRFPEVLLVDSSHKTNR